MIPVAISGISPHRDIEIIGELAEKNQDNSRPENGGGITYAPLSDQESRHNPVQAFILNICSIKILRIKIIAQQRIEGV